MVMRDVVAVIGLCMLMSCGVNRDTGRSFVERPYLIMPEARHSVYLKQYSTDSAYAYVNIQGSDIAVNQAVDVPREGALVLYPANGRLSFDTVRFNMDIQALLENRAVVHARVPLAMADTADFRVELLWDSPGSNDFQRMIYTSADDVHRIVDIAVDDVPRRFCSCEPGQKLSLSLPSIASGRVELTLLEVNQELPPPPFSVSSTRIPELRASGSQFLDMDDGVLTMTCPEAGAIRISSLDTSWEYTLPIVPERFPELGAISDMVEPLRYITTGQEYEEILYAEDQREAVEAFWMTCAGSKERAKLLMANYYGRIQEANAYFTDLVAGWKTDRGLTHVVFGPASRVERVRDRELWLYGEESTDGGLQLLFYHFDQVSLDRSLDYRPSWYLTVDAWRNGKRLDP